MTTTATTSVEIERVTKRFGAMTAVDDVSLAIRRGEFFSLLGPSGCGKTNLLRMIGGMEPEINARIVNDTHYASANLAAKPFIDPTILADPAIYPPDDVINRCEFLEDLGDLTTQLDLYWTEIKAE